MGLGDGVSCEGLIHDNQNSWYKIVYEMGLTDDEAESSSSLTIWIDLVVFVHELMILFSLFLISLQLALMDRGAGGTRGASAPPPPNNFEKLKFKENHRLQYTLCSSTSGKRSNVSSPTR